MVKQNQFGVRAFSGLIDDIFNGNHTRLFRDEAQNEEWFRNVQRVPVNVKETEQGFQLELIVPGVPKEEIKLQVNNQVLDISFEHKETANKEEQNKWLRKEFKVRSFKRSFNLSDEIDVEKISARHENGVLNLTLPKKEAVIATNKVIDIL